MSTMKIFFISWQLFYGTMCWDYYPFGDDRLLVSQVTFKEAYDSCELATEEEVRKFNSFFDWATFRDYGLLWIGMRRSDPGSSFRWVDGRDVTWENWKTSEPSLLSGKDCVAMESDRDFTLDVGNEGKWEARNCSERHWALCEEFRDSSKEISPHAENTTITGTPFPRSTAPVYPAYPSLSNVTVYESKGESFTGSESVHVTEAVSPASMVPPFPDQSEFSADHVYVLRGSTQFLYIKEENSASNFTKLFDWKFQMLTQCGVMCSTFDTCVAFSFNGIACTLLA